LLRCRAEGQEPIFRHEGQSGGEKIFLGCESSVGRSFWAVQRARKGRPTEPIPQLQIERPRDSQALSTPSQQPVAA
jgi:hypothetical protein